MESIYVGWDLHPRRSRFCVMDDVPREREYPIPPESILLEEDVPSRPEDIAIFLAGLRERFPDPGCIVVAVESTNNWYWAVDAAEPLVDDLRLTHPRAAKAILSARAKTDRLDAQALAWLTKNRLLPEVFRPPRHIRARRDVLRHRLYLVRARSRFKNRLHGILFQLGIHWPASKVTAAAAERFLRQLRVEPDYRLILTQTVAAIEYLEGQVEKAEHHLAKLDPLDLPAAEILDSLPGFGWLSSLHAALEIADIKRFPDADHLVSYSCLAPRTEQSGEKVTRLGLNKFGNRNLKWIFGMATQHAAQHPKYRDTYRRQARRKRKHPKMVARLTVARRMVTHAWHMLTKGELFRGGA